MRVVRGLGVLVAFGAVINFGRKVAEQVGQRCFGGKVKAVVQFNVNKANTQLVISRQSHTIHDDEAKQYVFTEDQLHKEYVIDIFRQTPGEGRKKVCDQLVFVKKGDGMLCGTGLFTQKQLSCGPVPTKYVDEVITDLDRLKPPTDRAVGLEFEFVARELTPEAIAISQRTSNHRLFGVHGDIIAIQRCAKHAISTAQRTRCRKGSDCSLNEFCHIDGKCRDRLTCRDHVARGGKCPVPLEYWKWDLDVSVRPLSLDEARMIHANKDETRGVAFEVKSPGPPHALSGNAGFRSTIEMLELLQDVGIQAGPSQGLHVHVNVMNRAAPGEKLSPSQIAAVWAAYAKYQFIIDEMLSPGRPGQKYAHRLFLGDCKTSSKSCTADPCGCTRRFFLQMHEWLVTPWWARLRRGIPLGFCNAALATPRARTPCSRRYPLQRYFQLNLAALDRFGTVEFRAHSATYDTERVSRWVQFLVSFVEYYGRGKGYRQMQVFFKTKPLKDLAKLQKAQRKATAAQLFKDLKGLVDPSSAEFYGSREWEQGDMTCHPKKFKPVKECCKEEDSDQDQAVAAASPGNLRGRDLVLAADSMSGTSSESSFESFAQPMRLPGEGNDAMRVPIPRDAKPGSYLDVQMPGGDVRAVLLTEDSVRNGFHDFTYDQHAEEQVRSILQSETTEQLENTVRQPSHRK